MITHEEQAMRREALEEAASYAHPEANAPDTIPATLYAIGVDLRTGVGETAAVAIEVHPDGTRTIVASATGRDTHAITDAIRAQFLDHRFRLAIRAALVGVIACLAVACGGRVDADPSSTPESVTCSTPEGAALLPASSVAITRADGSIAVNESCENSATCYVVSVPPPSGRGTEILHVVRGACAVSR